VNQEYLFIENENFYQLFYSFQILLKENNDKNDKNKDGNQNFF